MNFSRIITGFAALALLFIYSCTKDDFESSSTETIESEIALVFSDQEIESLDGRAPLSLERLDAKSYRLLEENNDLRWDMYTDYELWSAVMHSDEQVVSLGYKPAHLDKDISGFIHEIDVNKGEWKAVREALLAFVLEELSERRGEEIALSDIAFDIDDTLPLMMLHIDDYELIAKLRRSLNVRYVDAAGFSIIRDDNVETRSNSGCGENLDAVSSFDYSYYSSSYRPWNWETSLSGYSGHKHQISYAWNQSITGDNRGIAILDAGFSSSQSALSGSTFYSGYSGSRSRSFYATYPSNGSTPYTSCVHGTKMALLAAGPRTSGWMMGVAYKADFLGVRVCQDVLLNKSKEKKGLKEGLKYAANRSNMHIISMSIGHIFYSGTTWDGISYAHNKGKLLIAASGTSTWATTVVGMVYPAKHSNVNAVTGIKSDGKTCNNCHHGSATDFRVLMQRHWDNDRLTVTHDLSGSDRRYSGGTSCATATMAGMAALVWSKYPTASKAQIEDHLESMCKAPVQNVNKQGNGMLNIKLALDNNPF